MAQTYLGDDSVAKELENEEKVRLALEKEGFTSVESMKKPKHAEMFFSITYHLPEGRGAATRGCVLLLQSHGEVDWLAETRGTLGGQVLSSPSQCPPER